MRKVLLLGLMLFFASAVVFAQSRVITGVITSTEDGLGVPGATVLVKGTTIGTATDLDGNYSISVPAGSNVLVFSFVGLRSQEVTIGNQATINVALEPDVQALSEFVITSYGDQSKREITGAIASVKGEIFQDLPMQSFDRAMQGRIAGVQVTSTSGQPGGTLNVRIRGVGSINAGNDPLYIVDGVQVNNGGLSGQGSQNALASINPNDIESIEVLKDAAAAAIYGAQAANGVVLITTKKGSKGSTKTRISVQEGIVQPLALYDVMDATQLATIKRDAYINAGLNPANAAATYGNPEDPNLESYDWVDALYRTARLSVYDLSVSGGDEKTTFFLSGSYTKQEGQVIQSDYQRATGRLNLTHRPSKKFTVSANISLAFQETNGTIDRGNFVNGPFMAGYSARPNVPIYNEDGTFGAYPSNHLFGYNIVQGVYEELRSAKTVQTVSNLQLNYQFAPWLSFTSYFGIDFSDNADINNRPSTIPVFSSYGGASVFTARRKNNFNTNHNFNFNKKFNDVHTISGILGFEYKGAQDDLQSATGRGFPNPTLIYLQNAATPFAVNSNFTEYKRAGIFGQAKYDYDDRYTADFTLRRDGHSRFGEQNKWGTFYAASLGWRLSSEAFLQDVTWLDNLRMRASYGVTGNSLISDFASRSLVSDGGQYLGEGALSLSQLGNDLLTWEEAETFNIGLDWTLFNGRIIGTVDFWRKNSNDLLFNTPLPTDSGFGSITRNTGQVRNQGIDLDIQTVNIVAGKFQWNTGFNITFLENELISLYDGLDRVGNSLIVGKPISFWYMNTYMGVNPANGRQMFSDLNGGYTYVAGESTLSYIGSALPSSYGGLSNTLTYGPVSLEVFFQYQFGNLAFNQDLYNLGNWGSGTGNLLINQEDYWKQPGDITTVGRPYEGGQAPGTSAINTSSTRLLSDGGYIRLKQVTLNYTLPSVAASKVGMSSASLFVQGLNLATFTKYNGIDPEANSIGTTYGSYPNAKQFTAGINLNF
ncbi:SusC/RagA family TonB-linked outer membrane protein [Algoriphagus zhangzhouensis]|uniref:TonB-linked outer membrane protein, SusC/RagA family n=1 Tax=Algoriphagus zhangzhouensis TaxID=1073327 RepID=A0A1M7ZE32_9BACT|nr:TonB-dependent receptor [Algoriphagus zhangzhouensis]TDY45944.1 TonB-linked SusC/RagA family outer membrane protein [Algoriphagus zhangzhouensis]SHO63133.1 TonB-linked outer membrane protein, SusC/RagA family [Algoriphagus zhangzhouensis]